MNSSNCVAEAKKVFDFDISMELNALFKHKYMEIPAQPKTVVKQALLKAKNILILSPKNLDGDSIGSTLAMFMVLKKLGKQVTAICETEVPPVYSFLPQSTIVENKFIGNRDFVITIDCSQIEIDKMKYNRNVEDNKVNIVITPKNGELSAQQVSFSEGSSSYDLVVTVDCPTRGLMGKFYADHLDFFEGIKLVNIDHHQSNENYGDINYVDPTAASATHMLAGLFESLSEGRDNLIDEDIATCLFTGIVTDTGSFQNSATSPKALATAATLLARGARQQEVIKNIYKTRKLESLRLWGLILQKIEEDTAAKLIWSTVTQADLATTHTTSDDTGEIIDELMTNAPEAEIILLLSEKDDGSVTGSLRSKNGNQRAAEIATHFGGGGHPCAGGFRIPDQSLATVEVAVIEKIRQLQIPGYQSKAEDPEPTPDDNSEGDDQFQIPEDNSQPNITYPKASNPFKTDEQLKVKTFVKSEEYEEVVREDTHTPYSAHPEDTPSTNTGAELTLDQLQAMDPPKNGFDPEREMKSVRY